jgi:hypothetical protein
MKPSKQRPWRWIKEAYHRQDRARTYARRAGWLRPAAKPRKGDMVFIEFHLSRPLKSVLEEPTTWAILKGQVTEVLNAGSVRAEVIGSSDGYPVSFPQRWHATLKRNAALKYPWIVDRLVPLASLRKATPIQRPRRSSNTRSR